MARGTKPSVLTRADPALPTPSVRRKKLRVARKPPLEKRVVGWREWVGLPALGVSHVKAKLDTGARTSSLHAFDLQTFTRDDAKWVRFAVHPMQRDDSLVVACEALLLDRRYVTNSGGKRERRYVIETMLRIGEDQWPIELTLTSRDEMGFRMLVGRTAMSHRLIVDPARSFRSTVRVRRPRTRKVVKADMPLDEEE